MFKALGFTLVGAVEGVRYYSNRTGPVKVLPLGDSITFGCGDGCHLSGTGQPGPNCGTECVIHRPGCQGGYRGYLWKMLSPGSETSPDWDFVGAQKNGPRGTDPDHEGNPGWVSEDLVRIKDNWAPLQPDVILLHIGTNNLGKGFQSAEVAFGNLKDLVATIFQEVPHVRLLLATIIGSSFIYGGHKHEAYNNLIRQMGTDPSFAGRQLEVVDMDQESGIGRFCDAINCCWLLPPGVHPNFRGYKKMADVWYNHLTT